jgi:hypothetical protein
MRSRTIDFSRFTEPEISGPVMRARREPESDPNPRLVIGKPVPPSHFHETGYDSHCGLCCLMRQLAREGGR